MSAPLLPADPPARTTATGTIVSAPSANSDMVRVLLDSPGPPPDWHAGARVVLVPVPADGGAS
jgi:hypothetical protein